MRRREVKNEMDKALGEEGMGSEFGGLSNVSVVLQTKKAKAGIETFQYGSLLQHFR